MSGEEPTAVQLRVTLLDIEPRSASAWVPWRFHLGQLHRVIQAAFGWWDYHLHEFIIGGLRYSDPEQAGEPEFEDDARSFDEAAVRLRDFGRVPDQSFIYLYDFGDHWQHRITFERLIAIDPAPRTASCIAGARARPPEDVGGTSGYANFLDIITDPGHPEHAETLTWCGGRFDPEAFNLDRTNRDVTAALRANRRNSPTVTGQVNRRRPAIKIVVAQIAHNTCSKRKESQPSSPIQTTVSTKPNATSAAGHCPINFWIFFGWPSIDMRAWACAVCRKKSS